jgi:acyl-coenzyme A thioesterase PaaI-like protein
MRSRPSIEPPDDAVPPVRDPEAPAVGEQIRSHYRWCFGCGSDHPTGLHMLVYAGEGVSTRAELTVTEHHQGAPGLAHGGLLAAAFDEALGSLNWLIARPAVTARLETDFIRPVPVGSSLFITAEVVGVAGRKVYTRAEGRLGSPEGALAVTAAAVFVSVPLEHFTTHGRPDEVAAARADAVAGSVRSFEVNP